MSHSPFLSILKGKLGPIKNTDNTVPGERLHFALRALRRPALRPLHTEHSYIFFCDQKDCNCQCENPAAAAAAVALRIVQAGQQREDRLSFTYITNSFF